MRYKPRYITPVTLSDYQHSSYVEYYAPVTDYYITDLVKLSIWRGLKYIPDTQVWCPLNSFNIPVSRVVARSSEAYRDKVEGVEDDDAEIVCLQGAGDVLMATAWAREMGDRNVLFHTYGKFANLIDNNPDIYGVVKYDVGMPTDLMQKVISGNMAIQKQINMHYPVGTRELLARAMDMGWGHYDWMGFLSGMPIRDRGAYLKIEDEDYGAARVVLRELKGKKRLVGIHLVASSPDRTCMDLINLPAELPQDDIHYVLFGGEESSQVKGYNLLNLAGKLTYRETAAVVSMLDCLVCVDSVVMHLAALTDAPTLGIYKWSDVSWAGPGNRNLDTIMWTNMKEVVKWVKRQMERRQITG